MTTGFIDIVRPPDRVVAYLDGHETALARTGVRWSGGGVEVQAEPHGRELPVVIHAPEAHLRLIQLRWRGSSLAGTRFLGDAWERGYGDLQWTGMIPNHVMPWYFLASNGAATHGYGVKVRAGAICFWQIDSDGISLWLDVRCGGSSVRLGDRELAAAVVVAREGKAHESPHTAAHEFCKLMSPSPRNPAKPLYGGNNWYYAYGNGFGPAEMVRDAEAMSALVDASEANRPFMVIDMGWADTEGGAGPTSRTKPAFTDMSGLAARMKATGARPGLWTRPLLTAEAIPEAWRITAHPVEGGNFVLDPSTPEALEYIKGQVHTIAGWGYELIKHDFSTYDLMGRWGFQMGVTLTDSGWHFADRSLTTAEVVGRFYRGLREAVGDTMLLGCNTIGHLSAGLFEASRIGDDTSGRDWNRTWKMGVNCLAFRAPQHNAFFAADADCVPVTPDVPWEKTARWLELVAESGTALFVSLDPRSATPEAKAALTAAFKVAAKVQPTGEALDWMDSTTPSRWRLLGREKSFDWSFGEGLSPFAG